MLLAASRKTLRQDLYLRLDESGRLWEPPEIVYACILKFLKNRVQRDKIAPGFSCG
jgi:hypothetical protein